MEDFENKPQMEQEENQQQSPIHWNRENIKGDQATGEHIIRDLDKSKGRPEPQMDTDEHRSMDLTQAHQVDLAGEDKRQEELAKELEEQHNLH